MNSSPFSISSELIADTLSEAVYTFPDPVMVVLAPLPPADDPGWVLLGKILNAVGLTLDKVRIPPSLEIPSVHNTRILCFGIERPGTEYYSVQDFGTNKVVYAHRLDDLDDLRKKSLWSALKVLFTNKA